VTQTLQRTAPITTDKLLIEANLAVVAERAPDVVARFYANLFAGHPELQSLFGRRSQVAQEKMLLEAIVAVVEHMDDATWLTTVLRPLGATHVGYGVSDAMYPIVASTLLATLAEISAETWTSELAGAWGRALGAVATEMITGAHAAIAEGAR
jgi:hemoglobin-like flavoprotein